jgi:hypothetical protein
MNKSHRISAWGMLSGWLTLVFAAKTLRGDAAGLWILLDPLLLIGVGLLLVSSISIFVATFSSRLPNRRLKSRRR